MPHLLVTTQMGFLCRNFARREPSKVDDGTDMTKRRDYSQPPPAGQSWRFSVYGRSFWEAWKLYGGRSSSHGAWPQSNDTNSRVPSLTFNFDGESPCCVRQRAWEGQKTGQGIGEMTRKADCSSCKIWHRNYEMFCHTSQPLGKGGSSCGCDQLLLHRLASVARVCQSVHL